MKHLKTYKLFESKKININSDLISFFSNILINEKLPISGFNYDKDKLEELLKYSDTLKSKSILYVFISDFIEKLINNINSNIPICDLLSDEIYPTLKKIPKHDYIKTVIQLLEEYNYYNKNNKLINKYKKILRNNNFIKRKGTPYYDPPESFTRDANQYLKTHAPIASNEDVIESLFKYYKPGFSLLDIGAGYGNIMRISEIIGYKAKGIEIRDTKKYTNDLDIIYDDFFNVDSNIISEFDVIYFYRPFIHGDNMDLFLKKLNTDCKKGAIIIYSLPHIDKDKLEKKFNNFRYLERINTEVGQLIFKKI